jgi:hypothetical protein
MPAAGPSSAPKQHNSLEENEAIKAGKAPEGWEEKPAKNAQKDKDALDLLLNDNNAGKPEGIHLMIGRRPFGRRAAGASPAVGRRRPRCTQAFVDRPSSCRKGGTHPRPNLGLEGIHRHPRERRGENLLKVFHRQLGDRFAVA